MSINALIAQGGRPIGADLPEIANMLQQRSQQTLQNNRLATQDQYAAQQHDQQTTEFDQGQQALQAKQTYAEYEHLKGVPDEQLGEAIKAFPHIVEAAQKANLTPNDTGALRAMVEHAGQGAAAFLGQGPPKQVETIGDLAHPAAGIYQRDESGNLKQITAPQASEAITPYQQADLNLKKRGQDMTNAREKATSNKLPSGYELDPNKIGALRPIAGGPADPSRVKNAGTIADRMNPTMLASVKLDIAETRNALDKIKGLTTDTAGAFFSVEHAGPLASLFHRAATPEQMQNYDAYANRLAVAIASMQSMGRGQISDAKVSEARKLVPAPGDKKSTIGVKLGQIRRIADLAEQTLTQSGSSQTNPIADAVDETGGDTSGLRAPTGAPAPQGLPPDIAALVKKHGG